MLKLKLLKLFSYIKKLKSNYFIRANKSVLIKKLLNYLNKLKNKLKNK